MALVDLSFAAADAGVVAAHPGRVVVFADAALDPQARKVDRLTRGALARALASPAFGALKPGEALELAFPSGLAASAVQMVRLPVKADAAATLKAGASIGRALREAGALVLAQGVTRLPALVEGIALRAYGFAIRAEAAKPTGPVTLALGAPAAAKAACAAKREAPVRSVGPLTTTALPRVYLCVSAGGGDSAGCWMMPSESRWSLKVMRTRYRQIAILPTRSCRAKSRHPSLALRLEASRLRSMRTEFE